MKELYIPQSSSTQWAMMQNTLLGIQNSTTTLENTLVDSNG